MIKLTQQQVIKHRDEGISFSRIGIIYKVSRQRIHQILTKPKLLAYCCNCKNLLTEGRRKWCTDCRDITTGRGGRELIRDTVRKRDNYTCQDCGFVRNVEHVRKYNKNIKTLKGKIKSLDIHHLEGLCGKRSKSCDKIEDMHLLITLCHKCHYNRPEHFCKSEKWKIILKNKKKLDKKLN